MSFKLAIRGKARDDMFQVYRWYKNERPGLEEEWLAELDALLLRIHQHPMSFPTVADRVRRATVNRFPYHLFFTVAGKTVRVIACLHAKRDPDAWQGRV